MPVSNNRLLARLAADDQVALADLCEEVEFEQKRTIAKAGEVPTHAIFPESGIISIVVRSPEGQQAEAGMIGNEGFVLPAIIMGADLTPYEIQVQVAGHGKRIARRALINCFDRRPALREALLRFAYVFAVQSSFSLLSNAVHQVDERLARWLLMCHDRVESDDIPLTHEFMSLMLAVRRPSVTNALHILEGNGFIRADRGYVQIRNRAKLEDFAGDAYGRPEEEYRRLLG